MTIDRPIEDTAQPESQTRPAFVQSADQAIVQIEQAAVRLDGRTIWQDVNLDVYAGEFIAVLGPNGAGKSTLIKAILGLVPLSAGAIRVLGRRVQRGNPAVGYAPQRRHFGAEVHIRGRDLVQLGLEGTRWGLPLPNWTRLRGGAARSRAERMRVQAVIEMVGAAAYAERPIGRLSGGEQQRLLIAQALVTRPRILLLDEPLDSLDLHNQQEVSAVIRRISEESGAAVLLVAHDVNPMLQYVDRLVYVAQGRVAVGRPEEVINSDTLSRLYGATVEVFRARDGRLVVVGQPEGVPCEDHHAGHEH